MPNAPSTAIEWVKHKDGYTHHISAIIDPTAIIAPNVWIEEEVRIGPKARINRGAWIGRGAWIKQGACIGWGAWIRSGAQVERGEECGGYRAGYRWDVWRDANGRLVLHFGCLAMTLDEWDSQHETLAKMHEPEHAEKLADITRRLVKAVRVMLEDTPEIRQAGNCSF